MLNLENHGNFLIINFKLSYTEKHFLILTHVLKISIMYSVSENKLLYATGIR